MESFDWYPILEWVHIVNGAVLFGAGLGSAFHMWSTHKTGNVAAIAVAARNTVRMDLFLTTPAVILQPLTGVLMIVVVGFQWNSPWLIASYGLYALAGLCWIPVLLNQKGAEAMAAEAAAKGKPLREEYFRRMNVWFRFGLIALIALFLIFYMMVMKPLLWE